MPSVTCKGLAMPAISFYLARDTSKVFILILYKIYVSDVKPLTHIEYLNQSIILFPQTLSPTVGRFSR